MHCQEMQRKTSQVVQNSKEIERHSTNDILIKHIVVYLNDKIIFRLTMHIAVTTKQQPIK